MALLGAAFAPAAQPNFIVILTDDQGYADVGAYGSGSAPAAALWKEWDRVPIRTPRLDQLAAEGVRFTDFYVADNVCSPSRAALMTGSYPDRVVDIPGVYRENGQIGLNPNEVTLADLLKRKGYATACVGKWHLGDHPKFLPTRQGFDSFFGTPYSNDMKFDKDNAVLAPDVLLREGWTREKIAATPAAEFPANKAPLIRGEKVVEFPQDLTTITRRYTDEGLRFIAENAKAARPFFLYLAHNMPHTPLVASPQFAGKSTRGRYGDVIEELDYHIGRVLDTLKALGIDGNTLVVFTSDNGPWLIKGADAGTAYPLREGKTTTWEGGQRVPGMMRWPGRIPAGLVQKELASTVDIYPTFAALAGVPLPVGETVNGKPIVLDGVDIRDLMFGKAGATRGKPFYYGNGAVRSGTWKLRDSLLFDLAADIHEDHDLSSGNPQKKAEMAKLLADFKKNVVYRGQGTLTTQDPIPGCTNPEAQNFKPDARRDDGSCVRKTTAIRYGVGDGAGKGIRVRRKGPDLALELPGPGDAEIVSASGTGRRLSFRSASSLLLRQGSLPSGIYCVRARCGKDVFTARFLWP